MTKKRWLLATTCLASLIGVPILVIALLPPRPGVTKANVDRIRTGMKRAEVLAFLGDDGYSSHDARATWWGRDGGIVIVTFDSDNRVNSWRHSVSTPNESLCEQMTSWLPNRKKKVRTYIFTGEMIEGQDP